MQAIDATNLITLAFGFFLGLYTYSHLLHHTLRRYRVILQRDRITFILYSPTPPEDTNALHT